MRLVPPSDPRSDIASRNASPRHAAAGPGLRFSDVFRSKLTAVISILRADPNVFAGNFHAKRVKAGFAGSVIAEVVLFGKFEADAVQSRRYGVGFAQISHAAA